jgi:hypothetical protein
MREFERRRQHWFDRWGGPFVMISSLITLLTMAYYLGHLVGEVDSMNARLTRVEATLDAHAQESKRDVH